MTLRPIALFALLALAGPLFAACPSPSNYAASTPDPARPGETVVTDNDTGLMWSQCPAGVTSSDPAAGGLCDQGSPSLVTWASALVVAEGATYAGYTDWRVPNMIELHSLVDSGCYNPAINAAVFPLGVTRDYWSSTTYVPNVLTGWIVNFMNGQLINTGKTVGSAVRLVRGGQPLDAYVSNAPTMAAVSPDAGPDAGGTVAGGPAGTVTVTGTLFTGATRVTFDTTDAAAFTVVNDTTLTVAPPTHAAGTVPVRVTTPNGTSETSAAYTYLAAPTVASVTPNVGASAGGTVVVVAGTGFTSGATVRFGATAATDVAVTDATRITATAPAHADGTVDVTVTAAGGTSATSAADAFTYFTPSLVVDSLADGLPAAPLGCATGHAGTCRLRDAIVAAGSGDTITFAVDGTIVLAGATLVLDRNVTLDASHRAVAVDGNDAVSVFKVDAGVTARIANLAIRRGRANPACAAGQRCGGGVYNDGDLTLSGVTVSQNTAAHAGAGVFSQGALRLVNSTLQGNAVDSGGSGGGVYNAGTAQIINSTLWQNTAATGAGLRSAGGNAGLTLVNTIVGGMSGGSTCHGATVDLGGNLDNDGSCGLSAANGSAPGAMLDLGPLQNNGGPTPTALPSPGSLAIGYGRDDICAAGAGGVDQRGLARPQGAHCDAGATEVRLHTLTVDVTTPNGAVNGADGLIAGCTNDGGGCSAAYSAEGAGTPLVATLTAKPDAHHHLVAWGGDCAADGTVALDADRTCTAAFAIDTRTVGGVVHGLAGGGLELRLNGGDAQSVSAAAPAFTFAPLPDLSTWAVTVTAQPASPWQTCVADPASASGTLAGADVTSVAVDCTTNAYTIGGTVSGLAGGGANLVVQLAADIAQEVAVTSGKFAFAWPVASGTDYTVSIGLQPRDHTCAVVAGASGIVRGAAVADVRIACQRLPRIAVTIDDGRRYAPYGSVADYLVTLTNTGAAANGIAVAATLSPAFDAAAATWVCDAGSAGATCAASGSGPLADTVTLPADSDLTFVLSAPLHPATSDTTAAIAITASGATPATDTDTLVLFRDGFDDIK